MADQAAITRHDRLKGDYFSAIAQQTAIGDYG